jgi:alpha-tubulin suppressor-like RCC1 family protein
MKTKNLLLSVLTASLLTACGGGGGGSTDPQPTNTAPEATSVSKTTTANNSTSITLQATDADGDELTYEIIDQPAHGTLTGTAPILTYMPNNDYTGTDSFTYRVYDGKDYSNTATVTITIAQSAKSAPPVANDQSITLNEDGTYAITLTATDADGDQITTYMINSGVTHGTITGTEPNITYIPDPNYNGSDSLSFWAYTNSDDANGGYSNTATVSINVLPINDAPTANDFNLSLDVNETNTTTQDWKILASANDVDGDNLTATIQTQGSNGTFTINGDQITYSKTNASTTDSGVLEITDGTETVTVAIIQVNKLYWLKKGIGIGMKSNHTIWSWGSNANGEFGDGTETDSDTPVQEITQATDWKDFSKGDYHVVALKNNGTVWCWGSGANGQLANGSTTNENVPTQEITQATDWKAIGAGAKHTTALKTDGTIWSWGDNYHGKLALDDGGNIGYKTEPVQEVTYATDWDAISVGYNHVLALKTDGTVYTWGEDRENQLGNDTSNYLPTQEHTQSTNWIMISAGGNASSGLKSDGTVWVWGGKYTGIGGDYIVTQELTGSTDWIKVSASNSDIVMHKADGTIWGIEYITQDQLAKDTTPVQESSNATDWIDITVSKVVNGVKSNDTTLYDLVF